MILRFCSKWVANECAIPRFDACTELESGCARGGAPLGLRLAVELGVEPGGEVVVAHGRPLRGDGDAEVVLDPGAEVADRFNGIVVVRREPELPGGEVAVADREERQESADVVGNGVRGTLGSQDDGAHPAVVVAPQGADGAVGADPGDGQQAVVVGSAVVEPGLQGRICGGLRGEEGAGLRCDGEGRGHAVPVLDDGEAPGLHPAPGALQLRGDRPA